MRSENENTNVRRKGKGINAVFSIKMNKHKMKCEWRNENGAQQQEKPNEKTK